MMSSENYEEVCDLLDKLCLDTLTLMEEEIQVKINLENSMCQGENNLAKCRYIMGSNSVSALNIPLKSEVDIDPLVTVTSSPNDLIPQVTEFQLIDKTKEKYVDPIRWFSVLAPQNLYKSQSLYKTTLQWAVQAVNIQNQLIKMCDSISSLKLVKASLKKTLE